jgi:hypothetical protein
MQNHRGEEKEIKITLYFHFSLCLRASVVKLAFKC